MRLILAISLLVASAMAQTWQIIPDTPNNRVNITVNGLSGSPQVVITTGANPFTVFAPDLTTSISFTMANGVNPTLTSSTGAINIASLFVTNLAGTGTACLQTDASGNVTRTNAPCGTGGGGTPGAPVNGVQFNLNNAFTGDANFTYRPDSNPAAVQSSGSLDLTSHISFGSGSYPFLSSTALINADDANSVPTGNDNFTSGLYIQTSTTKSAPTPVHESNTIGTSSFALYLDAYAYGITKFDKAVGANISGYGNDVPANSCYHGNCRSSVIGTATEAFWASNVGPGNESTDSYTSKISLLPEMDFSDSTATSSVGWNNYAMVVPSGKSWFNGDIVLQPEITASQSIAVDLQGMAEVQCANNVPGSIWVSGLGQGPTGFNMIVSGGTGWAVGNTFSINGGSPANSATGFVRTVSAGVVTGIELTTFGTGYVDNANASTVATSGTGTGLVLSISAQTNRGRFHYKNIAGGDVLEVCQNTASGYRWVTLGSTVGGTVTSVTGTGQATASPTTGAVVVNVPVADVGTGWAVNNSTNNGIAYFNNGHMFTSGGFTNAFMLWGPTGSPAALGLPLNTGNGGTNANLSAAPSGSVPYFTTSPSAMAATAAGTAGQVLTSNGAAAPTWTTPTAGGGGAPTFPVTQLSTAGAPYQVTANDFSVCATFEFRPGGATGLTLPTTVPPNGQCVTAINYTSQNKPITATATVNSVNGTITLESGNSAQPAGVRITSNGTGYLLQRFMSDFGVVFAGSLPSPVVNQVAVWQQVGPGIQANGISSLPSGTAGQVLTSNGTAVPTWQTPTTGGGGTSTGWSADEVGWVFVNGNTMGVNMTAVHFNYGRNGALSFANVWMMMSVGDTVNPTGVALWDATANAMVCHSQGLVQSVATTQVARFPCQEGTVTIPPGHDIVMLKATTSTTAAVPSANANQVMTRYSSSNVPTTSCTYTAGTAAAPGAGITCNSGWVTITSSTPYAYNGAGTLAPRIRLE